MGARSSGVKGVGQPLTRASKRASACKMNDFTLRVFRTGDMGMIAAR